MNSSPTGHRAERLTASWPAPLVRVETCSWELFYAAFEGGRDFWRAANGRSTLAHLPFEIDIPLRADFFESLVQEFDRGLAHAVVAVANVERTHHGFGNHVR